MPISGYPPVKTQNRAILTELDRIFVIRAVVCGGGKLVEFERGRFMSGRTCKHNAENVRQHAGAGLPIRHCCHPCPNAPAMFPPPITPPPESWRASSPNNPQPASSAQP